MSRKRDYIPLKKLLASALCVVGDIPYADAKAMHAEQVISLFEFDHYPIDHEDDGPDEHWNLVPRLKAPHRVKTAADNKRRGKVRRIKASRDEHEATMAAKAGRTRESTAPPTRRKSKIPSRPFPKGKRPMQWRKTR